MLFAAAHEREGVVAADANEDVESLALSPDGRTLALGLDDTGIVLRDLKTGKVRTLVPNDTAEPAWFRADGKEMMAEVDSFTVGANVEQDEPYAMVMERLLRQRFGDRIEVLNAGVGAWKPVEMAPRSVNASAIR